MLNLDLLEKVLGLVSPPHFAFTFFKKYSINWRNFLSACNMSMEIICFLDYDSINVKINLGFPTKLFFFTIKNVKIKIWISSERK